MGVPTQHPQQYCDPTFLVSLSLLLYSVHYPHDFSSSFVFYVRQRTFIRGSLGQLVGQSRLSEKSQKMFAIALKLISFIIHIPYHFIHYNIPVELGIRLIELGIGLGDRARDRSKN